MSTPQFDVTAIGNAIVGRDRAGRATRCWTEHKLPKGAMNLIDADDRRAALRRSWGPASEASGGSAGNTIAGIAALGGQDGLHRQGRDGPARRRVHPRHRARSASPTTRRRSSAGCPTARSPHLRHARRAADDADVPRRHDAARARGREHGLHHRVEGAVSRGLPLGPAARQGGDARRGDQAHEGRRQGVAHAVRLVLRGALPRRVPRAGREASSTSCSPTSARSCRCYQVDELRRRAAAGARALRDRAR